MFFDWKDRTNRLEKRDNTDEAYDDYGYETNNRIGSADLNSDAVWTNICSKLNFKVMEYLILVQSNRPRLLSNRCFCASCDHL